MKIGILGANSFLARTLVAAFPESDNLELHFWSRYISPELENRATKSFLYNIPDHSCQIKDLLELDYIFICMASGVQPGESYTLNQLYEINAFEPIRIINGLLQDGYEGTIITFGSYFEIGSNQEIKKYKERDVVRSTLLSLNPYASSKRLLSRFISDQLAKQRSFRLFHFYLSNIYGCGEHPKRLIPYLLSMLNSQEEIKLGGGDQRRQYTHVKDIANFLIELVGKDTAIEGLYCLSTDEDVSVRELAENFLLLAKGEGFNIPPVHYGVAQRTDQSAAFLGLDSTLAKDVLAWKPEISLQEGLGEYFYDCKTD